MNRKLMIKLSGGLFAVGIAATSLLAQAPMASAAPCDSSPRCYTPNEPPIQIAKPDLTVQQFTVGRTSPNAVRFTVVIKNQGNAVAPAGFATLLSVDGFAEKLWIEMARAPGATRMVTYDFSVPQTTMTHLAGLRVDDGLIIVEELENNNYKTVAFK
jgi:hypothetical protein